MAYGINSNIQAVQLTDDVGGNLGQKSLSIPLTAKTLMISSDCDYVLALTYEDLFNNNARMILPASVGDRTFSPPVIIPAPSGTNGQLWFVAYDAGPNAPRPNSFISLMILE